ncbi:hypothetical protein [Serratia sp. UGAL515B_01]|uniref:hypothetical protein n=1 Tax=Serratia sp. UGAL515B_01 TaxID=2986763 RepID=UPI002954B9CE|nr:hypothetical protein [Serratia sp. UGAL515B_01]WON78254.1 hypothetical protein OK023_06215 [Serratia sp. UGAL515B_01]
METLSQNKWSSVGMLLGAIALILSIVHFTTGPFSSSPPTLESVVSEKVSAIKKGIVAGLKGDKPPVATARSALNIDKVLDNVGIGLAIVGLLFAFIAGMRKENRWSVSGALFFGGGTLAFHALLFGISLVFGIILLILIFSWLGGLTS